MKVTYAMPVKVALPERVPRVARLLALAHKFQRMLDRGEVESMAELARLGRVSRARITQIMDLLMVAPEIQEAVLYGNGLRGMRQLLKVARTVEWTSQRNLLGRAANPQNVRPVRRMPRVSRRAGIDSGAGEVGLPQ
jgi:hypothetical protein